MSGLRIRRGTPADHDLLAGLLRGLSPDSAYRRFQTGLSSEPSPSLVAKLLPDGPLGGCVLGFVGDTLVAHGLWARSGTAPVAEIAIVVADDYQEQGIGTAIAGALMAEVVGRGVERVEVFASATNRPVARMVARRAPEAERERDGATVTYSFPAPSEDALEAFRPVA